jgi:hypothetical protein
MTNRAENAEASINISQGLTQPTAPQLQDMLDDSNKLAEALQNWRERNQEFSRVKTTIANHEIQQRHDNSLRKEVTTLREALAAQQFEADNLQGRLNSVMTVAGYDELTKNTRAFIAKASMLATSTGVQLAQQSHNMTPPMHDTKQTLTSGTAIAAAASRNRDIQSGSYGAPTSGMMPPPQIPTGASGGGLQDDRPVVDCYRAKNSTPQQISARGAVSPFPSFGSFHPTVLRQERHAEE